MTGTDLEVRHEAREMAVLTNEQLQFIAGTEFVPPGLRGNLPAILACVATGRALGIADMSALRSIHIIDGKATFSAELMVQLVRRAGHSITGEVSDGSATVTGTRADNGDTMTSTWTLEMAERAGLVNKTNWKKYPEAMLWARAASQLCRMLFADCFAGATYTPEELEDVDGPDKGRYAASSGERMPSSELTDRAPALNAASGAPLMTAAQKKKANTLIGKLRSEGRLTNEEIYAAVGLNPADFLDESGELHWSPLRDALPKDKASALIDLLQKHEKSGEKVLLDPWQYAASEEAPDVDQGRSVRAELEEELLAYAQTLEVVGDTEKWLKSEPSLEELEAEISRYREAAQEKAPA